MEWTACPLCGNDGGEQLHEEGGYVMVRCPSCRFVYQNPRPSEEERLNVYQTYLPKEKEEIEAWGRMMKSVFGKGANLIERYVPRGRILDVGAGYGFFLALMQARGWKVQGVEVSPIGVQYGQDRLGLPMLRLPWQKTSFAEGEFDVVTAFYVIEHFPDPLAFLREVHRILRPGGMILLRYPHTTPIKNILALFRIRNQLYHLPFHLSDFSPKTMATALGMVGFKRVKTCVGGVTESSDLAHRLTRLFFGSLAEFLHKLSVRKILLPGVSKTTIATKVEQ